MLKGVQEKMVVVRTPTSRYYTRACFILRRSQPSLPPRKTDMEREAERIIAEVLGRGKGQTKGRGGFFGRTLLFFAGLLCGGGLTALLMLPWLIK